jgi:pimeloyl-ACP methyl ester carboxylesterase
MSMDLNLRKAHVNGIDICYEVRGSGEPLVMVMGLGAQLVYWPEELLEGLVDAGFQTIRFDNRDIGESTHLHGAHIGPVRRNIARRLAGLPVEAAYNLDDMADDVAGLLRHLHLDSAHILGVSMGGMIAQTMAIRHPHRVRTLTSLSSTTGSRRHFIASPKAVAALFQPKPTTEAEQADAAERVFAVIGSPDFDRQRVREMGATAYRRGQNPAGFLRQLNAILASGSRVPHLKTLRIPTLAIHGTIDPLIFPVGGRALAALVHQGRFVALEGMGHDLPKRHHAKIIHEIRLHARS